MYFAGDAAEAIERSGESSRTTHGADEAVDACRYFGGLLVGALSEAVGKDESLLSARLLPGGRACGGNSPLRGQVAEVAEGSFKHREPPQIRGTGYVVESMEAALWAFHKIEGLPGWSATGGQPGRRRRYDGSDLWSDRRGALRGASDPGGVAGAAHDVRRNRGDGGRAV